MRRRKFLSVTRSSGKRFEIDEQTICSNLKYYSNRPVKHTEMCKLFQWKIETHENVLRTILLYDGYIFDSVFNVFGLYSEFGFMVTNCPLNILKEIS